MLQQGGRDYLFVRLDAFNLKTADDFLEGYVRSVASAFSSHEELLSFLRKALPRVDAQLSIGLGSAKLTLHLDRQKTKDSITDIINMPQVLAEEKRVNVIVCIDEFQVVAEYAESLAFQRMLRSCWQTNGRVAYCLFGSKYNLMTELVGKPKMPLYKFGDMMYLSRIGTQDWVEYIVGRFADTGKQIPAHVAEYLVGLVKNHSYYVQQLAQFAWFRTEQVCTEAIVDEAFDSLVGQLEMIFMHTMEDLKPTQVEYLRAVCDGVTSWNSVKTLNKYKMGTAANVKNIKAALEKKEIITSFPKQIELQDPVFETWLKQSFWG